MSSFQEIILMPQRWLRREMLPVLADLRLAIALLLLIALLSISGTVIEQGQTLEFYQNNYPTKPALFGFLTWQVILATGLNHVYGTWWFLAILILFGSSLTACTFTRQLPALKAARNWNYYQKPKQFAKLALSAELAGGSLNSLEQILQKHRYKVFQEGDKLYARKGIVGRIGPIAVHASMLLILGGAIWGGITGFMAQEMVAQGDTFQVKNIIEAGALARPQIPTEWGVKVNRFWIDYTPKGGVDQFYSDLSVVDQKGQEIDRQTIHVNQPLRHKGVTFYQTDWGIAAVKVKVNNSPVFELPMGLLQGAGQGRIWGTWIPTKPDMSTGVSLVTRDLQGTFLVYDTEGKLLTTVRTGMAAEVNGVTLRVLEVIGSTGLQIKADPGIPFVYAGFLFLMLGVVMSYISHSQVWALTVGDCFYIGGKTNRSQVLFEREMLEILEELNHGKNFSANSVEKSPIVSSQTTL